MVCLKTTEQLYLTTEVWWRLITVRCGFWFSVLSLYSFPDVWGFRDSQKRSLHTWGICKSVSQNMMWEFEEFMLINGECCGLAVVDFDLFYLFDSRLSVSRYHHMLVWNSCCWYHLNVIQLKMPLSKWSLTQAFSNFLMPQSSKCKDPFLRNQKS